MFNTKRIIFLIGLLSLVTLTGALLAGPAFAAPKSSDHEKVLICHFAEAVDATFDAETGDMLTEAEDAYWKVINVDPRSMDAHLGDGEDVAAHSDGASMDTLIDDSEFAAENTTTSTDCDGREVRA